MKILIISTSDAHGGGSVAAKRLLTALNKTSRATAKLLVSVRKHDHDSVAEVSDTKLKKLFRKFRFALEKAIFLFFEVSKKERFAFSTAFFGSNISRHPLVREADVLHLHWINHSFLSHRNIRQLMQLGKPVVITLHDMWYFTGGCHYSGECTNFMRECGNCKFLKRPHPNDLSHRIWKVKTRMYAGNVTFIACSSWLADVARTSSLIGGFPITNIVNPIDTAVFRKTDKTAARKFFGLPEDKILILYVAVNINDERKGYKYLSAALKDLYESDNPLKDEIEIVVMGNVKNREEIDFHFPAHFTGSLSNPETIVACFNSADLFVAPSLEDNLPNVIVESMACGTPVVAFNTGGIPDIIDHGVNGYLAAYKDTRDLIAGIEWVISTDSLPGKCLEKIETVFSEDVVAGKFNDLYADVLPRGEVRN